MNVFVNLRCSYVAVSAEGYDPEADEESSDIKVGCMSYSFTHHYSSFRNAYSILVTMV